MRTLLLLFLAPLLHAATYIVPSDGALVQGADEIVVATGVSSRAEFDARGGIVTRYTLLVEETLKGGAVKGTQLTVTERGGVVGGRSWIVPGAPRYETGVRYLLFTSTNRDLEPVTLDLSLGRFELRDGLALRSGITGFDGNFAPHREPLRDARRFLLFIRAIAARRFAAADYFVPEAESVRGDVRSTALPYSRYSYLLDEAGVGYRWKNPAATWVRAGTQPGGDGALAVLQGLAEWSATDSVIDFRDGGEDPFAVTGLEPADGRNAVLFNDPNDEIPDNSSIVGMGGAMGGEEYSLDGEHFFDIVEGDVVIANRSFSQACLNTIMAHELGHTLGMRHSNQPPTGTVCGTTAQCTGEAVMNSSVGCEFDGRLQGWDENAAATVYGDGVECDPPAIVTQPRSLTTTRFALIRVRFEVRGTEPLRYSWFEGPRGDTLHPVGTGAAELILAAGRPATTQFWVRVTNDCGTVDSEAATITIPVRRRAVRQ